MLPPMNEYSIAAATTGIPSSWPEPTMTASFSFVAAIVACSRSAYRLVSVNCSGSLEVRLAWCSSKRPPSNSDVSRSAAPSRKWCAHLGQTWMFFSRSFL